MEALCVKSLQAAILKLALDAMLCNFCSTALTLMAGYNHVLRTCSRQPPLYRLAHADASS